VAARAGDILDYLDDLLEVGRFEDYGPNGLQVPGADEVERVVSGVSASLELFRAAADRGAQLVLVHHGLLWDSAPRRISPLLAERLAVLLGARIGLAAYHLPLDAHPEVGNNALIADGLGAESRSAFGAHRGRPIGCAASFGDGGVPADELIARVRTLTGREPLVFANGPERVRTLGIVSGGASDSLAEAVERSLDAFLTGEPTERVMSESREGAIHFIAAGHYATETFGIRRLGELVAERFGVGHDFVDLPNPI
jgi:dinuclear metal center YbgI/SA1388 family protein